MHVPLDEHLHTPECNEIIRQVPLNHASGSGFSDRSPQNNDQNCSVAVPDPHHLAGSGILDPDPDPRLQNGHLINLFSEEKFCE
jgi:hypothetical protein